MEITKKYYPGLDLLKYLMSITIIMVHTKLFYEYDSLRWITDEPAAFRVPTFFAISAYLFYLQLLRNKESGAEKHVFVKKIKRLFIFYAIWWTLMLPMSYDTFFSKANLKEVIFAVFLNSTFSGYWFLKALIINSVILYIAKDKKKLIVTSVLFFSIYFVVAYNRLYQFYDFPYKPYYSFYYHTGFFLLGAWLTYDNLLGKLAKTNKYVLIMLFFVVMAISFQHVFQPLCIMLYPIILMALFYNIDIKNVSLCKKLRIMSILYYAIHFLLIYIYKSLCTNYWPDNIVLNNSIVTFIIVFITATVISLVIIKLEQNPRFSLLQYLH